MCSGTCVDQRRGFGGVRVQSPDQSRRVAQRPARFARTDDAAQSETSSAAYSPAATGLTTFNFTIK